jgi:hypothetical protein
MRSSISSGSLVLGAIQPDEIAAKRTVSHRRAPVRIGGHLVAPGVTVLWTSHRHTISQTQYSKITASCHARRFEWNQTWRHATYRHQDPEIWIVIFASFLADHCLGCANHCGALLFRSAPHPAAIRDQTSPHRKYPHGSRSYTDSSLRPATTIGIGTFIGPRR